MPDSDDPVYRRVARALAKRIEHGSWPPGTKIPSERELAEEFTISRMTARASVDVLVDHGLVQRRERIGAFVAPPKLVYDVTTPAGLSDQLKEAGMIPGAAVWDSATIDAEELSPSVRELLGLADGNSVHRVQRLRTAGDEPIALENSYFPAALFPDLLECDLTASIYELMRERFHRGPARSVQEVDVLPLGVDTAQILGASPDSPALVVERCSWDAEGIPIEFARDIYRSDRIKLRASSPGGLGALSAQPLTTAELVHLSPPDFRRTWRSV